MAETSAVRPFDWRDLPLLHRVRERGLCLDAQLAYTRAPQGLPHAMLDLLTPGRGGRMLVARPDSPDGDTGIGQIALEEGRLHARVTFISPSEIFDQPTGMLLLEALAGAAGERGAHSLIAEVDEGSPACVSLRKAGYATYARQRIWRLEDLSGLESAAGPDDLWREAGSEDAPAIHYLYFDLVPALVQQAEDAPRRGGWRGLVHWQEGELLAYLDIEHGPLGTWVQPYFHPAAEKPQALLSGFLYRLKKDSPAVYLCVRSYQSWLNSALEPIGFDVCSDQAVMVKRLAAYVRSPALARIPNLEGTRPEPTAPFANAARAPSVPEPK